uniref:Retrovirus-related Pol polyprotein LINE-1 n=1 Tax=Cajanus cajan TaxID=3821 RepID=A0A151T4L8_CAJCA|nr:Retrovirus-related Pol polyprotein LINE-1 [Cajanus cajan]
MVNEAFQHGKGDSKLLDILITLIPKTSNPTCWKELRPISLCNVSYKIISKVLVNRLRPLLQDLINPLQGSFLPGRGPRDNSIIAQEVLHHINHHRGKKGLLAIKIDLEKAYDRLSWDFLQQTLLEFGFPGRIVSLIMWGVCETSLSILWNGSKLDPFTPSRGLRQGDPLAPYLFLLCMEKLGLLIHQQIRDGNWIPVTISK